MLTQCSDVIMTAMASQITSLTIVYSTVYSRHRSKKTSKLRVTGLCEENSPLTGEFPAQRASNAENVSIWWCNQSYPTFRQQNPFICLFSWTSGWQPATFIKRSLFTWNHKVSKNSFKQQRIMVYGVPWPLGIYRSTYVTGRVTEVWLSCYLVYQLIAKPGTKIATPQWPDLFIAAVTPVEYECDSKNIIGIFTKSKKILHDETNERIFSNFHPSPWSIETNHGWA